DRRAGVGQLSEQFSSCLFQTRQEIVVETRQLAIELFEGLLHGTGVFLTDAIDVAGLPFVETVEPHLKAVEVLGNDTGWELGHSSLYLGSPGRHRFCCRRQIGLTRRRG